MKFYKHFRLNFVKYKDYNCNPEIDTTNVYIKIPEHERTYKEKKICLELSMARNIASWDKQIINVYYTSHVMQV